MMRVVKGGKGGHQDLNNHFLVTFTEFNFDCGSKFISVKRQLHKELMMKEGIIARLFTSFAELEESIENAKSALMTKGDVPETVFVRLGSYDGILNKQRKLAGE